MRRASRQMAAVPGSSAVDQDGMTTSADKRPSVSGLNLKPESSPDSADPAAPSKDVTSRRQRLSDLFTIFCAGFALISDGYQNNLM